MFIAIALFIYLVWIREPKPPYTLDDLKDKESYEKLRRKMLLDYLDGDLSYYNGSVEEAAKDFNKNFPDFE